MKLHEKIRYLRKNVLKMSLKKFHKELVRIFGDDALTYDSIMRLERGYRTEIRPKSLDQICAGLGISLEELKQGSEKESKIALIIKAADKKHNLYPYNENAIGNILTPDESRFFVVELPMQPGGITREEEDPTNKHEKLISVLQGEIMVCVGKENHLLKRGDSIYFASNVPHHLENPSRKVTARCMIVQNPKSYLSSGRVF